MLFGEQVLTAIYKLDDVSSIGSGRPGNGFYGGPGTGVFAGWALSILGVGIWRVHDAWEVQGNQNGQYGSNDKSQGETRSEEAPDRMS